MLPDARKLLTLLAVGLVVQGCYFREGYDAVEVEKFFAKERTLSEVTQHFGLPSFAEEHDNGTTHYIYAPRREEGEKTTHTGFDGFTILVRDGKVVSYLLNTR